MEKRRSSVETGRRKLERSSDGPQSPVLIFPSQSVQYIQGAKRRCRSVNGRFHLKSRSLGPDKGIITRAGAGESQHAVSDT